MRISKLLLALPLLFSMTGALFAQDQPQPLTSVALWKVAPKDIAAFTTKAKAFVPTLDKLIADGTVSSYGMDVDMLHVPGQTNVAYWYTVANWSGIQKAEAAIDSFINANPQLMADIDSMQDASAHRDIIVRSLEHKFRKPSSGLPVWDFSQEKVKEGMGRDYVAGYRAYIKPVLDKLFADGVICGYSLDTEAIHTDSAGTYWEITCLPDLAARDKVAAAFEAEGAKRSAAERDMMTNQYRAVTTREGHRDSLSTAVILNAK